MDKREGDVNLLRALLVLGLFLYGTSHALQLFFFFLSNQLAKSKVYIFIDSTFPVIVIEFSVLFGLESEM